MADSYHRSFFLEGSAGRIEALLWTVSEKRPTSAAVVCHPHPLYGGTMHNKVVYQAAKALHEAGMPVLRFNFRGTGLSEGEHENGLGERDDVRTAIDYLAHEFPGATLLVAGFSFGAWVGLRVGCEDPRVTRLIGIGIPVAQKDMRFMRNCEQPKLFISGSQDEYGPLDVRQVHMCTWAVPAPAAGSSKAGQNPSRPSVPVGQPHPSSCLVNVHAKTTLTEPARTKRWQLSEAGTQVAWALTLKRQPTLRGTAPATSTKY